MSVDSPPKDPKRVRAGQIGARARWGEPRVLRLDTLSPAQRAVILALLDATKAATPPDGAK